MSAPDSTHPFPTVLQYCHPSLSSSVLFCLLCRGSRRSPPLPFHIAPGAHMTQHVFSRVFLVLCVFPAQPTATGKKPKINPVRRMLSRMGSQMDPAGGASGDESESKQV